MHELSIAENTLQLIEDAARQQGFRRVKAICLEIGELSNIERESLLFCFDAVTCGTIAEGARVEIRDIPGSGWCRNCAQTVAMHELYAACPLCSGYQLEVNGGDQMRIKELEVE